MTVFADMSGRAFTEVSANFFDAASAVLTRRTAALVHVYKFTESMKNSRFLKPLTTT